MAVCSGWGGEEPGEYRQDISGGSDRRSADGQWFPAHLMSAQTFVEETRWIVAQHPKDCGTASGCDEASKQRDQQASPNPLILPIRGDIEREHLAGEKAVAPIWSAAAKTENGTDRICIHAHVTGFAQHHASPASLAALFR